MLICGDIKAIICGKRRDPHIKTEFDFDEKHAFKVGFVEHHTPFNVHVYVSRRNQIQFTFVFVE